ncbi:hypothetical protein LEN26_013648 [Aphanomyces euteiches]|nr:hypothetical protein LEN26_013648 [Aphanomyces euteiches]KAH9114609.1 hypothetical protein AeMF1_011316 [Aphanomyces euteiches]KAH9190088.1 hypothetical protein AeNC1_007937 [Aphanomyces euteiches]
MTTSSTRRETLDVRPRSQLEIDQQLLVTIRTPSDADADYTSMQLPPGEQVRHSNHRDNGVDTILMETRANKPIDKRVWQQGGVVALFLAFFLVAFIPFVVDQNDDKFLGYDLLYVQGNLSNLELQIILSNMNTNDFDLTASSTLGQPPSQVFNTTSGTITKPFRILVGSNAAVVTPAASNPFAPLKSKIPLATGSIGWYPFDKYELMLPVAALTGSSAFDSSVKPLDLAFVVLAPENFDWKFTINEQASKDASAQAGTTVLQVHVRRKFNLYVVLVFVGIWAVTFSIGYIGSCAVIWQRRAVDNPVIFVSALFAVPAVRNTLPGKPPYGCLFDILCTYFAIAACLTYLVLMAISYMKRQA